MAASDLYGSVAQQKRQASRAKAETESDYRLGRGRVKQDYRFTKSALDRALQKNLQGTLDDYGGRGLHDSGMRRNEQAQQGEQYAMDLGMSNLALSRELENLNRARTKGSLGVQTGLEGSLIGSTGESLASILQRALNDARNRVR